MEQRHKLVSTACKSQPFQSDWRSEFEMKLINAKIRKVGLAQGGILSDRSPVMRLEFRSRPVNVQIIGIPSSPWRRRSEFGAGELDFKLDDPSRRLNWVTK